MELRQHCASTRRRQLVADAEIDTGGGILLNGLDYLEVLDRDAPSEDWRQRLIDVTFIRADGVRDGPMALLGPDNFRLTGGSRITGIRILEVDPGPGPETLRLTLDRAGDFSTYELAVTAGAASEDPPVCIDPALSRVAFGFKIDCPGDFDCAAASPATEKPQAAPVLNYLAKDYASFRQMMLDRMATTMPDWTDRNPADPGVMLVELLADAADRASYFQDAVGTEAFLPLARLRGSVTRHARLLGYRAGAGCNARTAVQLIAAADRTQATPLLARGTKLLTAPPGLAERLPAVLPPDPERLELALGAGALCFETMEDVFDLKVARNEIRLHDWGDNACCLPKGSTVAHLVGAAAGLGLAIGDLLIFEERIPPGGSAEDVPDPAHRQLVRLTATPKPLRDRVLAVDVLEVAWGPEDALTFPLNLADDGGRPASVALGNLVLADEGRTVDHAAPRSEDAIAAEDGTGLIAVAAPGAALRPRLDTDRLTHAVPYDAMQARTRPAATALLPAATPEPQVALTGEGETWLAKPDLLASDRFAPDFKVEPMDGGRARVLFGDGVNGRAPDPEQLPKFRARLRTGAGTAGNVGADAIRHVVTAEVGLLEGVRNPIAAVGARPPDSSTAIKTRAARAFRSQKRAVTTADYVAATEGFGDVQRARAERLWTGSWSTIFLSVDRKGGRPVDEAFEAGLRAHLEGQRLAGHDLEIVPPVSVGLDIALIVCVDPDQVAARVEAALLAELGAGYTADGTAGFFHPDNFSFGQPVRLSALIARAMAVAGVGWVGLRLDDGSATGRFERRDQPGIDHGESGQIPIGPKEVARMDNDPSFPDRGRLTVDMRGGR